MRGNNTRHSIWLALLMAIAMICGVIISGMGKSWEPPLPTPSIASRTIGEKTLPFSERWRWQGVVLGVYDDEGVVANEKYVCFIVIVNSHLEKRLRVIDARNGKMLWETEVGRDVYSLAVDAQRVFVAADWRIRTYELATGQLLWRTSGYLEDRTWYRMEPVGDDILLYTNDDNDLLNQRWHILRLYDAQSGELKEMLRFETSLDRALVIRQPYVDCWTDGKTLWGEDRGSGQILWRINLERRLEYWPILVRSMVIYADGFYPNLYAIDVTTGSLLWTYPGALVSNFALEKDTLYALRQDGRLVAIGIGTGQEKGYVQFLPPKTEEGPVRSLVYWVAAAEGRIFVYFGDSQELIGMEHIR